MRSRLGLTALIALKRILRPFDLDVAPIGKTAGWLSHSEVTDPLTYLYLNEMRQTPLVELRIPQARLGVTGVAYNRHSGNPFVAAFEAAAAARSRTGAAEAVRRVMSDYYAAVSPDTALDLLSLDPEDAPGLVGVAAQNNLLPWGTESLSERAWRLKLWAFAGSFANRRKIVLPAQGMTEYGPVSERKLGLEVERILKLHEAVEANGFQHSTEHPMEVIGLRSGGEYRWISIRGRHRFAICAARGIDRVNARVRKVVRREDAPQWPRVVSGTFSQAGALRLFDRLFAGEATACALPWTEMRRVR